MMYVGKLFIHVVDMLILRQTLAQIYRQNVLYVLYGLETAKITNHVQTLVIKEMLIFSEFGYEYGFGRE